MMKKMPQKPFQSPTAEKLGVLGLPESIQTLSQKTWDVIIVGGGHNGLTCAAYLSKAGKRVLLLEAHQRIGGTCTIEEMWLGYRTSPCAYLAGLLHPLVLQELDLPAYGFHWVPAEAGMFVPFEDGNSIQLWEDRERCEAEIQRFAPGNLSGWRKMRAVMSRLREAILPPDERDCWIGKAPTREMLEERLNHDEEARALLFEWSMAEYVDRYLTHEPLKLALLGQGVIGTNASPFDPGTASINFHHASGRMDGQAGQWGYVQGGISMVSFLLCDIAQSAGSVIATGVPVSRIIPGESVELDSGETIKAPIIVSNADPMTTLNLLGNQAPSAWHKKVVTTPMKGCTVKMNVALHELPNFVSRPGLREPHHLGQINTPLNQDEWKTGFQQAQSGKLPKRLWTELYFQTACDTSIAPEGKHLMSIFAQYVPHTFAEGDWDTHREKVGEVAFHSIGRFCSNFPDAVIDSDIKGPPDIEKKVGLSGGHIFHGECLPDNMWSNRLDHKTPMPGLFLCGAGTHPRGSVIAINGRNAAMAILED